MEYKSLAKTSAEKVCEAFNDAFSDYEVPIQMPYEKFVKVGKRRGANYEISMGAYDEDRLAGFVVNAGGLWQGKNTIYDCFTGVTSDYQRRGIATKLIEESFENSKKLGFENYLLEVIQTNIKAYELYKRKGFEISRCFDVYRAEVKDITFPENKKKFNIKKIENADWDLFETFWNIYPSWQNSTDSVKRIMENFEIFSAFDNERCIGYLVLESNTGDVPQLSIHKEYRRKGVASSLIKKASENRRDGYKLSFLNIDSDYKPFSEFMKKLNFKIIVKQYEMIRNLR